MIKIIKIGNIIHENIKIKHYNENGDVIWNIPNNLEELKKCTLDTINWLISYNVKQSVGSEQIKLAASNSKSIVLLAKIINTLNPDTDALTDIEKENFQLMLGFAEAGYSDSELVNNTLKAINKNITDYVPLLTKVHNSESIDELIEILKELKK